MLKDGQILLVQKNLFCSLPILNFQIYFIGIYLFTFVLRIGCYVQELTMQTLRLPRICNQNKSSLMYLKCVIQVKNCMMFFPLSV